MPERYLTDVVVRTIEKHSAYPNLQVVDLSCGQGELVKELHSKGCQVIGTRYKEGDYIIKNDRLPEDTDLVVKGVDLTKPLPFGDSQFDVVVSTEVIEHLTEYRSLIYEIGRVLKPGGLLLLSTPNIYRLHSRICFLLTGTHKLITRREGWDVPREEIYRHHITPVSLPYINTLLYQAEITIEQICATRVKYRHIWTALLYPAILIASFFQYNGGRHNTEVYHRGEHALRKWMVHPATLFSEQLFLVAKKKSLSD